MMMVQNALVGWCQTLSHESESKSSVSSAALALARPQLSKLAHDVAFGSGQLAPPAPPCRSQSSSS